jgi:methylmalonyl-CoA mutase C-terminal domain/subunit
MIMSPKHKPIKVLLSRSYFDCHQRGVMTVAAALRDAGMEVIYTKFYDPEEVAQTAMEEDVDVVGLSFLAWGQMEITPRVIKALNERKMDDVLVIVGGVILDRQIPKLLEMGVAQVFGAGSSTLEIAEYIKSRKS